MRFCSGSGQKTVVLLAAKNQGAKQNVATDNFLYNKKMRCLPLI